MSIQVPSYVAPGPGTHQFSMPCDTFRLACHLDQELTVQQEKCYHDKVSFEFPSPIKNCGKEEPNFWQRNGYENPTFSLILRQSVGTTLTEESGIQTAADEGNIERMLDANSFLLRRLYAIFDTSGDSEFIDPQESKYVFTFTLKNDFPIHLHNLEWENAYNIHIFSQPLEEGDEQGTWEISGEMPNLVKKAKIFMTECKDWLNNSHGTDFIA